MHVLVPPSSLPAVAGPAGTLIHLVELHVRLRVLEASRSCSMAVGRRPAEGRSRQGWPKHLSTAQRIAHLTGSLPSRPERTCPWQRAVGRPSGALEERGHPYSGWRFVLKLDSSSNSFRPGLRPGVQAIARSQDSARQVGSRCVRDKQGHGQLSTVEKRRVNTRRGSLAPWSEGRIAIGRLHVARGTRAMYGTSRE
ncbi:hypothetical protein RJ55_04421 [Drechmeria coniospora]|nr:hypothetical protein RJ55_04421 [Drechmeria coniospora]